VNKYTRPITSVEWQNSYLDDLFVEMYEDLLEQDKDLLRELSLKYLGMEVSPTGDPLIDKWERQIARGEMPDLNEGEDDVAKSRDALVKQAYKAQKVLNDPNYEDLDFSDSETFGEVSRKLQESHSSNVPSFLESESAISSLLEKIPPSQLSKVMKMLNR